MAIFVATANPQALLTAIKKAIDDKKVVTWSYDSAGDFTHDVDQWRNQAWLRPTVEANRLVLGIVKNTNVTLSNVIYGVYHGRYIEMLLTHHDDLFSEARATAGLVKPYDIY